MARQPRIIIPNGIYHIISRGNRKEPIFLDYHDYYYFIDLLRKVKEKYKFKLLSFVIMNNHFHLLLKTTKIAVITPIMASLLTTYAMFHNRKHNKVGYVFQGRYKSMIVESDDYLTQLVWYIHNNPVRAELVESAEEYPFSSLKSYLNNDDSLVDIGELRDSPYANLQVEKLQ